jgi:hypothetical protein
VFGESSVAQTMLGISQQLGSGFRFVALNHTWG